MFRIQSDSDYVIGVVGGGVMGRGIVQVAATGGFSVRLVDVQQGVAEEAMGFIAKMLGRAVEKGKISAQERDLAVNRISVADDLQELAGCDLVIEAVVEKLEVKRKLFLDLELICGGDTILVSNTSALPIASIAANCNDKSRVAGMHFMNPVPLMKLVEVIYTPLTDPQVMDVLMAIGTQMGKTPIRVKDGPAFLAGNCARAFYTEALRFSHESIASPSTIDRLARDAGNYRMGPFQVMDLVGLDVNYPATQSLFEDYSYEPRYRPTPEVRLLLEAGLLGRKSGRGFYRYDSEGQPILEDESVQNGDLPSKVWLWGYNPSAHQMLEAIATAAGVVIEKGNYPEGVLAIVAPLGEDASTTAARLDLDPARTIAVDVLYGWDTHRTLMAPPGAEPAAISQAIALFSSGGIKVSRVNDSPGFILPRLQAAITNLGCDLCQQGIATPEDLDLGMRLGFNFPEGPLEAGDRLGSGVMLRLVEALYNFYGDDRYRPSPWLRRRGQLKLSLMTPETM